VLLQHGKSYLNAPMPRLISAQGVSDGMIEILNGLLHHNSKKRFTAEEALIRARAVDEVTKRGNKDASGPVSFAPPSHSPHTHFGTSPVSGTNYFPQNPLYAPRSSRYREDFEEVEFLVSLGTLRRVTTNE
jgi:translation initiation factor 2-alpha kinase 4